nr:hypothetical protein [Tanacetum cinerariifolium]
PKPKASARRKRNGSDTSITPPIATTTPTTTVAITLRLTATIKGKQPANAKSPSDPSEVARTEAYQLKIVLRRSRQQTHISQLGSSGTNEGTSLKPGVADLPTDELEEEILWNSSDDEGDDAQEKVGDDDEGDEGKDSKEGEENDDDDEDKNNKERDDDDDDQEVSMNAQLKAEVLTRSSHSSRTSYAIAADLSEMELKKILIEKMEGNKSIQRSNKQRNLYKALVDAYEADKTILDSYRETVILKRRRDDDDDDQEERPFAGSDRGSKRRREGKGPESASAPLETATRSAGRSITGSKSRQVSANESAFIEEPL